MDLKESLLIRVMIVVALPVVASFFGVFGHGETVIGAFPTAPVLGGVFSATAVTLGCQFVCTSLPRVIRIGGLLACWLFLTQLVFLGMEERFSYGIWFFLVGIWITVGVMVGIIVDSAVRWESGSVSWRFSLAELLLWMVIAAVALKVVRVPVGNLLREAALIGVVALVTTFAIGWLVARSTPVGWSLLAGVVLAVAVAIDDYWFRLAPEGFGIYAIVHSMTLYILLRWVAPLPWSAGYPRDGLAGSCEIPANPNEEVPPDE